MDNEQYKAFHEDIWRNRISVPYPYNNVVFSSKNGIWAVNNGGNALAACGQASMNPAMLMYSNVFNRHDTVIKHLDVSCSENVYPVKNFNSMNKKLEAAKKWLKNHKK